MEAVATIPYTPRKFLTPGYMLGPFTSHLIASHMGLVPLLSVNRLGAKGHSQTDADRFILTHQRITQTATTVWRDDVQDWTSILQLWSSAGIRKGWLSLEQREVWRCSCGLVEFLPEPLNLVEEGFRRKTYSLEDGRARCEICRTFTKSYSSEMLLMKMPTELPVAALSPDYSAREWANLGKQLNGKKLLVSRGRDTGVQAELDGRRFHVDVDVCNMLMPFLASEQGTYVHTLVCGHKTLKQAFLSAQLTRLMGARGPRAVVSVPYMNFDNETVNGQSVDVLLDTYDARILRILYAMALNHSGKSIILRSSLFETIEHAFKHIATFEGAHTPSRELSFLYKGIGLNTLQKALSFVRKKQLEKLTPEMRAALFLLISNNEPSRKNL